MCVCLFPFTEWKFFQNKCVCVWCVIVSYFIVIFWMPAGTNTFIIEQTIAHAVDFNLWTYYMYALPMEMDALWYYLCVGMCAFFTFSFSLSHSLTHPLYICFLHGWTKKSRTAMKTMWTGDIWFEAVISTQGWELLLMYACVLCVRVWVSKAFSLLLLLLDSVACLVSHIQNTTWWWNEKNATINVLVHHGTYTSNAKSYAVWCWSDAEPIFLGTAFHRCGSDSVGGNDDGISSIFFSSSFFYFCGSVVNRLIFGTPQCKMCDNKTHMTWIRSCHTI